MANSMASTTSIHETARQFICKSVQDNHMIIFTSGAAKKSFVNEILLHDVFRKHDVDLTVHNVDEYQGEDATVIHQELTKLTKQPSFPYVWCNGVCIGGQNQTKRALQNGDLEYYLDL